MWLTGSPAQVPEVAHFGIGAKSWPLFMPRYRAAQHHWHFLPLVLG
jgi:hypothetical protein